MTVGFYSKIGALRLYVCDHSRSKDFDVQIAHLD
jgi:hypothetical protein